MTALEDPKLAAWIMGLIWDRPTKPGSFLKSLAESACRADAENYEILRPALLKLREKYPKYHCLTGQSQSARYESQGDLLTGNHERDEGSHGK